MSSLAEEEKRGNLFIIGGAEGQRDGDPIYSRLLDLIPPSAEDGQRRMVVITTATEKVGPVGHHYRRVFSRLGLEEIDVLDIGGRDAARREEYVGRVIEAGGVFLTGGDQLRITSILGGTPVLRAMYRVFRQGAVIAGTSAGAAAMSGTMIVSGRDDDTPQKKMTNMAPGLGFIERIIIDQHFAQRGRIVRLLDVIAQNPYILGVGIDEDTAVVVEPGKLFEVTGSGSVTVLDGLTITHNNISELNPDQPFGLFDIGLHILPAGYSFDFRRRRPFAPDRR